MSNAMSFQKVHEHLSNILRLTMEKDGEYQDTFPRTNFTDVCTIIGNFTFFNLPGTVNVKITLDGDNVVVVMVKT